MAFINSTAAAVFGSNSADTINSIALNGSFSTIYGGLGSDILVGGTGADSMVDGAGGDYYQVVNIGDKVIEGAGAGSGTDRVDSSVTFTLGDNDEKTEVRKSMESELARLPRTQQLSIYCTFHLCPIDC